MAWVHRVLAIAGWLFVGVLALGPVPVVDLWWQMKTGQLILETGAVPHADPFSYTAPGAPWVVHEWLPSVLFYWLYTHVGPDALVAYKILGVLLAFAFVFWRCVRRTGRWLLSGAMVVLGAMAARTFFDIRPQIFSYVLFGATLAVLEERRAPLWLLPPLILVWANLHAGFVLGFLALGVALAAEAVCRCLGDGTRGGEGATSATGRRGEPATGRGAGHPAPGTRHPAPGTRHWARGRSLVAVTAVSAVLSLAQPNGFGLWRYPFLLTGHPTVLDFILEWRSPDFHAAWTRPFELLLLLGLLAFAASRFRVRLADLALLAILGHAALTSIRHIPLFAIACTPIVAEAVARVVARVEQRIPRGGAGTTAPFVAAIVALVGLVWVATPEVRAIPRRNWFGYTGVMAGFPVAACDAIEENGWGGNLFNDYKWGGYCIWRFYPERKVFIDGRAEVYFGPAFDDYYAIHNVFPDWAERLRRRGVETVLVENNSYLARLMAVSPEWVAVYRDAVAVVYRPRSA
jgi:hypothetical protein